MSGVKKNTLPVCTAIALAVSSAVYFALLALCGFFVLNEIIGEENMPITAAVCAYIAALVGGVLFTHLYRQRKLWINLALAAAFALIMYAVGFAIYDDLSIGSGGIVLPAAMLAGGLTAGFTGLPKKKSKKRKMTQKRLKKR